MGLERIRRFKTENFSIVDNSISRDRRINLKTRGLYYTVMLLPDDWEFSVEGMAAIVPDGRDALYRCLNTLIECGYVERIRVNDKGRFAGYDYVFYESPFTGKPDTEKPTQSNNTSNKTNTYLLTQAEAYVREDSEALVDDWFGEDEEVRVIAGSNEEPRYQPSLLGNLDPKPVDIKQPIPKYIHSAMHRICFLVETEQEALTLDSAQRGRVSSVLGKLRDAGADFKNIKHFEDWWKASWYSKTKNTNQYQAPRPEQVLEHWWVAMKSLPKDEPTNEQGSEVSMELISQGMQKYAKERRGQ